mmetsp:Transcript_28229/g.68669  ORF Transcript_28229/g.68669 Transcript_28229/m.68669 type:complete len:280 (-) Transcript_28229:41-880(-)
MLVLGHRSGDEIRWIGECTVLVEQVLDHTDLAIEVDVNLIPQLLLADNRGHELRLRGSILLGLPFLSLGLAEELAKLLVEVQADVELKVGSFSVLVDIVDTPSVHVRILNLVPRNGVDEIGLCPDLAPISVEEGDRLLRERETADMVEELEALLIQLLYERLSLFLSLRSQESRFVCPGKTSFRRRHLVQSRSLFNVAEELGATHPVVNLRRDALELLLLCPFLDVHQELCTVHTIVDLRRDTLQLLLWALLDILKDFLTVRDVCHFFVSFSPLRRGEL